MNNLLVRPPQMPPWRCIPGLPPRRVAFQLADTWRSLIFGGVSDNNRFYRRRLPHWEEANAAYFITFRVDGSLPRELLERAQAEMQSIEQRWKLQSRPATEFEMERLAVMETYLDRDATNPILADPKLAALVRDALLFHHTKKYDLLTWCIMPNHVHLLLKPLGMQPSAAAGSKNTATESGVPSLAEIMHSIKSYTSNQANKLGLVSGSLWQREYFDRRVRNEMELQHYVQYIRLNPVTARLVKNAEDYQWVG